MLRARVATIGENSPLTAPGLPGSPRPGPNARATRSESAACIGERASSRAQSPPSDVRDNKMSLPALITPETDDPLQNRRDLSGRVRGS